MPNNLPDNLPLNIGQPAKQADILPKARVDLEISEQIYYGKPCYVLKDPASLRYWRLQPPEYTIFQMLDGKSTMEDVLACLAQRFPGDAYDAQAVMSFIIMLRGGNLLEVAGDGSTEYLLNRKKKLTRNIFQRIRTEFLFFKIPVVDPDKMLNAMNAGIARLIYSRAAAFITIAMVIGAVALLVSNIDKLGQRQPLLSWINLMYMGIGFLVIKFIHEFGHGLTAKRFGIEVHEMGILFLVFTPCFYCDVSDAWMIGQKSRRMWITAAGIVVEIVLAALATYIWALTESRTIINQFALNIMVVASINTILFNGNPLLRYDGYYFLMDLMEIPNLRQKGSGYISYLFHHYVLGTDSATKPIDVAGRETGVLSYAICATIYRWFIMIAITTMVWKFLDPYGWGVVGAIMAMGCIYTSFITPISRFVKFIFLRHSIMHIRIVTASILAVLFITAICFVLLIPIEQSVDAPCVLRPASLHPLYVTQPGFIVAESNTQFIRDGQHVTADQTLLVLSDAKLEYRLQSLAIKLKQLNVQKQQAMQAGAAALGILKQIEAEIKSTQAKHNRAADNLSKLTIKAPISGVVQLRTAEPLEKMQGMYLPVQSAVMAVYETDNFEAVAAVNHRYYSGIKIDQNAQIKLWPLDNETLQSYVSEKPSRPVASMSSAMFSTAFGGEVQTMPATEKADAIIPAEPTFELALPLSISNGKLRDGMVGRAKIIVEKKTLGRALYIWFIRTIKQDIRL